MSDIVHVVHGNMNHPDGTLHAEYRTRLEKAVRNAGQHDLIVVTGGRTIKGQPAEAVNAQNFLREKDFPNHRIVVEDRSRTTGENIIFVQKCLKDKGVTSTKVIIYHRCSAVPKTVVLYNRLWSQVQVSPVKCSDHASMFYRMLDRTLFWVLAHIDPHETSWVWRTLKTVVRNPQKHPT